MDNSYPGVMVQINCTLCNPFDYAKAWRPVNYEACSHAYCLLEKMTIIISSLRKASNELGGKNERKKNFMNINKECISSQNNLPKMTSSRLPFCMYSYTETLSLLSAQNPFSFTMLLCWSLGRILTSFLNSSYWLIIGGSCCPSLDIESFFMVTSLPCNWP